MHKCAGALHGKLPVTEVTMLDMYAMHIPQHPVVKRLGTNLQLERKFVMRMQPDDDELTDELLWQQQALLQVI
jgi:hypothetical protein